MAFVHFVETIIILSLLIDKSIQRGADKSICHNYWKVEQPLSNLPLENSTLPSGPTTV